MQETVLIGPARTVLSLFGDRVVLAGLLVSVLLLGVLTRRSWAGAAGVAVVLSSVAVAAVAKVAIPRPDLGVESSTTHNSFPSGHVSLAMSLLLAFVLVVPRPARWWIALPGSLAVAVIASATTIAGWHRFSDVVGSVLLAVALFCLAAAALTRWRGAPVVGAEPSGRLGGLVGGMVVLLSPLLMFVLNAVLPGTNGLFVALAAESAIIVLAVVSVVRFVRNVDFVASPSRRYPG